MLEKKIQLLKGRKAEIMGHNHAFKSAVLLPLIKKDGQIFILFEKRALSLRRQPGEICFPGGENDPNDLNCLVTAVRETCEELGTTTENIEIIAPLDIMVSPFNAIVHPFTAWIKDYQKLEPNSAEVAKLILIPLEFLLKYKPEIHYVYSSASVSDGFPYHLIPGGENYPFRKGVAPQYFYIWEDEVIWGMTALILTHFLELIKN